MILLMRRYDTINLVGLGFIDIFGVNLSPYFKKDIIFTFNIKLCNQHKKNKVLKMLTFLKFMQFVRLNMI